MKIVYVCDEVANYHDSVYVHHDAVPKLTKHFEFPSNSFNGGVLIVSNHGQFNIMCRGYFNMMIL